MIHARVHPDVRMAWCGAKYPILAFDDADVTCPQCSKKLAELVAIRLQSNPRRTAAQIQEQAMIDGMMGFTQP